MTKDNRTTDNNIAGIVLSGGAGMRMGGLDKGLQVYQGKALIKHVIKALAPQTSTIVVCANRNLKAYQELGFDVIEDQQATFEGPLAGISSALAFLINTQSKASHAVISSCDTPHLPDDLVMRLLENIGDHKVAAVHDGRRRQNLHCLIRRDAWQSMIDYFKAGKRTVWHCQNSLAVREVDFSDQAQSFANLNRLEDFKV